ncbi:MAG: citrate transporter [Oscillospiraceae bacterium]|nr:citrate transporter [Oscillospiraceae bacterium]
MLTFVKAQPVLVISFLAALLTAVFVPPDAEYLSYCNFTVLIELFALMAAVSGLRSAGLFEKATQLLLRKAGTVRRLGLILMLLCFFSAMLVTNDVALLTFVPLTLLIWESIQDEKTRIFTIVLETAATNLGSMLTPIGNPQNLYLYDRYHLTAFDFIRIMLPTGLLGLAALLGLIFFLPSEPCTAPKRDVPSIGKKELAGFGGLFALCLLTVLRVIPAWALLIAAILIAFAFDHRILMKIDYALLATFVCFFIFVGNIGRIPAVQEMVSAILSGRELLVAALLSQVISNVPAAVMLAGFTENGADLLLGVDIGGFGTLIASLASLISFQIYRKAEGAQVGRFLGMFTLVNAGLLAGLLITAMLF